MGLDLDAPDFEFKRDKPLSEMLIDTPQPQQQQKNQKKGKRRNKQQTESNTKAEEDFPALGN